MLAKAGVTATIRVAAYAAVEPDVLAGNFDLFILSRSYLTDTNDPGGFLASDFGCKGSYNLNNYCDAELDALIGQLSTATEPARLRSADTGPGHRGPRRLPGHRHRRRCGRRPPATGGPARPTAG